MVSVDTEIVLAPASSVGRGRPLRCRVLGPLGRGGMAELHRAIVEDDFGRRWPCVIKRARTDSGQAEVLMTALEREAVISSLLHHENLVHLVGHGTAKGQPYLVMEYLHGRDLRHVLKEARRRRAPLPVQTVAFVAREAALGLAHAHGLINDRGVALGLVHRDVNPANLMILFDGGVKVLDFGIAKAPRGPRPGLTRPGQIKGKVGYMAPEQVLGGSLDARTDVFALGLVIWEMLVGSPLFGGCTFEEAGQALLEGRIPPPSRARPGVPPALDDLVGRMLARHPGQRPRSAAVVAAELTAFCSDRPTERAALRSFMSRLFGDEAIDDLATDPATSTLARADGAETRPLPLSAAVVEPAPVVPVPAAAPARSWRGLVLAAGAVAMAFVTSAAFWSATPARVPAQPVPSPAPSVVVRPVVPPAPAEAVTPSPDPVESAVVVAPMDEVSAPAPPASVKPRIGRKAHVRKSEPRAADVRTRVVALRPRTLRIVDPFAD